MPPRLIFWLSICLLLVNVIQSTTLAQEKPLVLAFYYAWFDDNTWASGQPADIPAQPYRSADAATIERHVTQAKNAGINAFVQSWYGPQVENNQTETNFRTLLDIAGGHDFQAAVDVEVAGPFFPDAGAVQTALNTLLNTHIQHPAYLRFQGKPVIFFWRQQRFSPQQWAQIRQAVDPNHTTYWIAEGVDLSYQDVFDGHHLYSIAWAANPETELNKWPPRLKKVEERLGVDKLWVATAMPGYNDLNLPRANAFARNRENGAYYRQTWGAAQATQPDMIIITSFNEWLEGTHLEPSVAYGDFYLNLTRELVDGLTVVQPPAEPEPIVSPEPEAQPETTTAAEPDLQPDLLAETVALVPDTSPNSEVVSTGTPDESAETATRDDIVPEIESQAALTTDVYYVETGDTLSGIAVTFDVPVTTLVELNDLTDPDALAVGQAILLDGDVETGEGEVSAVRQASQSEDGETTTEIIDQATTPENLPDLPLSLLRKQHLLE